MVTITSKFAGGNLEVHPSTVVLHKSINEQVVWECPSGEDFDVDFGNDTPFANSRFDHANPRSGLPQVPPDPTKKYKYIVRAGGQKLDPDVIVEG
jgi:hypothetical protein